MILPDSNVWIALISTAHPFRHAAKIWIASVSSQERIVFCRISQMSVLRLLTTSSVMASCPMTQSEAWRAFDDLMLDMRIDFLAEPTEVQAIFHRISNRNEVSPKRWQDDYLLSFAEAANLTFVTFDRALAGRAPSSILLTP